MFSAESSLISSHLTLPSTSHAPLHLVLKTCQTLPQLFSRLVWPPPFCLSFSIALSPTDLVGTLSGIPSLLFLLFPRLVLLSMRNDNLVAYVFILLFFSVRGVILREKNPARAVHCSIPRVKQSLRLALCRDSININ